jgi:DIL domain
VRLTRFLNADLFNRIITSQENCSRATARRIQVNLSTISDYLNDQFEEQFSYNLFNTEFEKTRQLLKLLQMATTIKDLNGFQECINSLGSLTLPQLHQAMKNYRFEVGEPSFPTEIQSFVQDELDKMNAVQSALSPREIDHKSSPVNPLLNTNPDISMQLPPMFKEDGSNIWTYEPSIPVSMVELMDASHINEETVQEMNADSIMTNVMPLLNSFRETVSKQTGF